MSELQMATISSGVDRDCAKIPLTHPECGHQRRFNRNLNQWCFRKHQQEEQEEHKWKLKQQAKDDMLKAKFELKPLPDYAASRPPKEQPEVPSRPNPLQRDFKILSTEEYKRISPEMHNMMERLKPQPNKELEDSWYTPIRVTYPEEPEQPHVLGSLEEENPQLAKYLRELVQCGNETNDLYGIDFCDTEGEVEEKANPFQFMDPYRLMEILNNLSAGGTLDSDQLKYLKNFFNGTAELGGDQMEMLLDMLTENGILDRRMRVRFRDLVEVIGGGGMNSEQMNKLLGSLGYMGNYELQVTAFYEEDGKKRTFDNEVDLSDDGPFGVKVNESDSFDPTTIRIFRRRAFSSAAGYRRRSLGAGGIMKDGYYTPWHVKIWVDN